MSFLLGLDTCFLEELDISDNFICTRGALALFSVFDTGSQIKDEVEDVAAVGKNRFISRLDLRKNETEELTEHFKNLSKSRPRTLFLFDLDSKLKKTEE